MRKLVCVLFLAVFFFGMLAAVPGDSRAAVTKDDIKIVFLKDGKLTVDDPVAGDIITLAADIHNAGDSPITAAIDFNITKNGVTVPELLEHNAKIISKKETSQVVSNGTWSATEGGYTVSITVNSVVNSRDFEVRKAPSQSPLIWIIIVGCAAGLIFAFAMAKYVLKQDTGTEKMRAISDAIKEGAEAFLRRQYKTIWIIAIVIAAVFAIAIGIRPGEYYGIPNMTFGMMTAGAFILGAACSSIAGYIGMYVSIRSNIRTASASRKNLDSAVRVALWGGAVSGFAVVAMSLLGVAGIYYLFNMFSPIHDPRLIPLLIVGFGFGASLVALFAQLGGGIYTKAADVGADLVGKVEKDIPEDDPRNAAVIADLVGDNVGDCAGRGADLFESTAAENIGAMILGIALYPIFGINGIMFPLVARAFGLLATMVGVLIVKTKDDEDPMKALNRGYYLTCVLGGLFFGLAAWYMLGKTWYYYWACGLIGILASIAFVYITQYYTESKYRPVKEIAKASQTGPATNIISGLSVGMECTGISIITISGALLASYFIGSEAAKVLGMNTMQGGLYGTAIATMGMLATCAYILALDTFGPITDNAGGINEMSGDASDDAQKITAKLDAVGNTTKALTKGYAVGSAALAAFLLFSAYMTDAKLTSIDLAKPVVFIGAMLGAMLVFVFTAFAIRAVGKAAQSIIEEVRRQFREMPGIMKGEVKPDYARCVDITTKAALKEMVLPGLIAVITPIAVGLIFRAEALGAALMVGTIAGVLMALVLNNGGGAWDNAKKYIEEFGKIKAKDLRENPDLLKELRENDPEIFEAVMTKAKESPDDTIVYGKTSDAHKAAVVGDTVGDPCKDTAGPSLHILVKLLSTITLVLAPLFI